MPYLPHNWVDPVDDQLTAENLNHIEAGVLSATETAESKLTGHLLDLTSPPPPGAKAGDLIFRTDSFIPPDPGIYPEIEGTVSTNGSQGTSTLAIAAPVGIAAGDYLFALVHNQSGGASSQIQAAGWELLHNWPLETVNGHRTTSLLGLAVEDPGSMPGSWDFSPASNASARMIGAIWRMSGVDPGDPIGNVVEPESGMVIPSFIVATEYNRLFSFCLAQVTDNENSEFPTSSSDPDDELVVDLTSLPAGTSNRSSLGLWTRSLDAGVVPANEMLFQTGSINGGWASSFVVKSLQP